MICASFFSIIYYLCFFSARKQKSTRKTVPYIRFPEKSKKLTNYQQKMQNQKRKQVQTCKIEWLNYSLIMQRTHTLMQNWPKMLNMQLQVVSYNICTFPHLKKFWQVGWCQWTENFLQGNIFWYLPEKCAAFWKKKSGQHIFSKCCSATRKFSHPNEPVQI